MINPNILFISKEEFDRLVLDAEEKFMKELADLYNKYGIDTRLQTHDFLLAEATWNFIAVIHNTIYAKDKLCSVEINKNIIQ